MQEPKNRFFFHLLMMVLAVVLSVTTVVFASVPLFLLRASAGRNFYFLYTSLVCFILALTNEPAFILPLAASVLLVALFEEARQLTCSLFQAGLASVLSVAGLLSFAISMAIQFTGLDLVAYLTDKLDLLLSSIRQVQPEATIETQKILVQLPSAVLMVFMISLWFGIIGSSFLAKRYKALEQYIDGPELNSFKHFSGVDFFLPPQLIWLALPVLALAFVDFQWEALSIIGNNLLNVLVVMYFFHGLSLIAYFFQANAIGPFWQWFWYIILLVHMFLLVSSIGFADYWMDFRSKIRKYLAKANQGSIK